MITIEEVRKFLDWYASESIDDYPERKTKKEIADLAISQHEEIARLRADSERVRLCYEAELEKLRQERAEYVACLAYYGEAKP